MQRRLGLQNATFFAAPMPDEYAESGSEVQRAVDQAIRESEENGISKRGKEVTPWLLSRVAELTHGKSMDIMIDSFHSSYQDVYRPVLS